MSSVTYSKVRRKILCKSGPYQPSAWLSSCDFIFAATSWWIRSIWICRRWWNRARTWGLLTSALQHSDWCLPSYAGAVCRHLSISSNRSLCTRG